MRWLQAEYILKGVFLGLLVFLALRAPDVEAMSRAGLYVVGGLALALIVAAVPKLRQGYKLRGRVLSFLLFLLLESSFLVYAGILLGTTLGALEIVTSNRSTESVSSTSTQGDFLTAVLGGALLGLVFSALRNLKDRRARLGLSLALGALLVAGALCLFGEIKIPGYDPENLLHPASRLVFGLVLILGMPVFYLLTFAGNEEESEIEIAIACAAIGLGTWVMIQDRSMDSVRSLIRPLAFVIPVMFYFGYTMRIMPGLRVFKHTLRGISHARIGRYPQALRAYRRALTLDPNSDLAREGYWAVHRDLDLGLLADDPETLSLVDFDLCLERAGLLLMEPPTPAKLDEANRLLGMVTNQRPDMRPAVDYWNSVAHTHCHLPEQAAADLERVLDPATYGKDDARRKSMLLRAWQLGLMGPEELRRRVGLPQIAQPGRRMEAIAAAEHRLAEAADDGPAWGLKRLLYQDLGLAEFQEAADTGLPATDFDYSYAQQLGLALINDSSRWQRGGDYLRMAAHGMPALGPSIFVQIAQAHQNNGNAAGAWHNYELAKRAGRAVGPKSLADPEKQAYFAVVKMLGEAAQAKGDHEAAIENFHLYAESERSGLETLRTLATLYEAKGDPLAAAHVTEQALVYNAKDKDLLARKDKYYYSVLQDDLRAKLEQVRPWFDVDYCFKKAKTLLDARGSDLDCLDWAQHLIELGRIVQPESLTAKVLLARAQLRRGEKEEAAALLESVRTPKPEKFVGADDEDSWYLANRLLGDLYLDDLGRADLAVTCFNDFRHSSKSGADTMYKLGRAYEQIGDTARAVKCYKQVTGYDGHPLAPDAHDALQRLQTS
jgi:tetratricopeptide (TPR) repeat protein